MEEKRHIICPNCHTATYLDKKRANSWRTMDPLESIVAGVGPVLLSAAIVCMVLVLCRINAMQLDYAVIEALFLGIIILSMPVSVCLLERYEKKRRAIDGYEVYCVQCPSCKNIFRIVRPTTPPPETPVIEHSATE